MPQSKAASTKRLRENLIERRAIDVSGGLGSLYDASTDNIIEQNSVGICENKNPKQRFICRIFSNLQSNEEISLLKELDFDGALRQSILLGIIKPSGICSLINYNRTIDQNTRFFYYCYRSKIEKLHIETGRTDQMIPPPSSSTLATHRITKILRGFEILCIIQVSESQSANTIDQLLHALCSRLENNHRPVSLTSDEREKLTKLTDVTVYGSQTCINTSTMPIVTIFDRIATWESHTNFHQPLQYTMQSLRCLYNNDRFSNFYYWSCEKDPQLDRIEPKLVFLNNQIKDLYEILQNLPAQFASETLNQDLTRIREQFSFILNRQEDFQEQIRKVLIDIRRCHLDSPVIDKIFLNERYICLHEVEMEIFYAKLQRLSRKVTLLKKFEKGRIRYINALDICSKDKILTTNEEIFTAVMNYFSGRNEYVILWYSSDYLKDKQAQKWKQMYREIYLIRQQTQNKANLVYVDFSQCKQWLENFQIFRLPSINISVHPVSDASSPVESLDRSLTPLLFTSLTSENAWPSLTLVERLRRCSMQPVTSLIEQNSPLSPTELNVLILSETSVEKSTFINAFINYLTFDTLQQAEDSEPVVLIPFSFPITIGDNYDEFIVNFGIVDTKESSCKSYVCDLDNASCLRLIDTPYIDDTQSDLETRKIIDQILTCVNHLSHLNAICVLLKTKNSQLNVGFRSCIYQLLAYLNPAGYNNIIFCFLNAGEPSCALTEMNSIVSKVLTDEHENDVSLHKENTFRLNSAPFRYLAARKCDVDFNEAQKRNYSRSWTRSTTEATHLLRPIRTCKPYISEEWISPRKVVLDILMLVRPLMETVRLMVYNWKLSHAKLSDNRLVMNSSPVGTEICTHCVDTDIVKMGPLWTTQRLPVRRKTNESQHHLCPLKDQHFPIEYAVQYEFVSKSLDLLREMCQNSLYTFLFTCDRLFHFLRQHDSSSENDPFGSVLERFVKEEEEICRARDVNFNINQMIYEGLQGIQQIRRRNSLELLRSNEQLSISQVYELISELMALSTVKKQVNSIKLNHEMIMKSREQRVSINKLY